MRPSYMSIFTAKCKKKQNLHVHWQKISTASLKNGTGVSVRFSNYECFMILLLIKCFSIEHLFPFQSIMSFVLSYCANITYWILTLQVVRIVLSPLYHFRWISPQRPFRDIFCCRKVRWRAGKRSNPHIFRCFRVEERLRDNFMAVQHLDYTGWLS